MEQSQLLAHCGSSKITREELKVIPTPPASPTHQPLPHYEIVGAVAETLSFRQISVVREEYAVSGDGMKMFGALDLETTFDGCRFAVGIRNSNDKSMRLGLTVGARIVCDNMAFFGDFTPVLAKHTKNRGVSPTRSRARSRNSRLFPSSGRRPSSEHFLKVSVRREPVAQPTTAGGNASNKRISLPTFVNPRNVTEVDVVDGLVEVYGRNAGGGSVLLEPGFSTRVAMGADPEQPEPTNKIRPEVERPEPGENEIGGKPELEVEFERAEVDRDIEIRESAEITEMIEVQEIFEQTAVPAEVDIKPGSEPQ